MAGQLTEFLLRQNWMRVLQALRSVPAGRPLRRERSVRELVDLTALSPAGLSDVLRRLSDQQVVQRKRRGNKLFYSLNLNVREEKLLAEIAGSQVQRNLQTRAAIFSKRRKEAVGWIDQTVLELRRAKHKR